MASLQARHQNDCAVVDGNNRWTPFAEATKKAGCTCKPLYHLAYRAGDPPKLIREPVGHLRDEAKRALDAHRGDVAHGTFRHLKDVRFAEFAEQWLDSFAGKETTRQNYTFTVNYAKATFGGRRVRDIAPSDVEMFLERIRNANHVDATDGASGREASPATLAKHLRQLGACLESAIPEYATSNPVRLLHKTKRPKVAKSKPAYFTDDELARLWLALAKLERPVVLALTKTAVATGARFGELAALRWADVNLLTRELHIARTWSPAVNQETTPKSGEGRIVDLIPAAVSVLETWYTASGTDGSGLVFSRDDGNGDREHFDSPSVLRQALYPAMATAGIPRVGERGRDRDFHSLRHTFARIALKGGAEIVWVKNSSATARSS